MATKIKILVVDDIAETRKNLRKLLELEEDMFVIGEASNGAEAIACALNLHPDVILMDINMPIMDGIQATQHLTSEARQMSIIILSVQGEQEYLRKAMAAGAREYLIKPPSSEELVQTVRKVVQL